MHFGTRRVWLVGLVGALAVGCVTVGRPLPEARPPAAGAALARAQQDVPLVPVPPPPLGREEPGAARTPPAATPTSSARAATPPAATPPPATPSTPSTAPTPRQLYHAARDRFATVDSYIVRLTRREMVGERMNAEEVMLFKFRKEPWSVYFKWLKEGKGREVVYVKGRYENKIHSLLAAGDIPLMPAGKRMALSPDSALVRNATRHPIGQAGIGAAIDRIGMVLSAEEKGDRRRGTMLLVGPANQPGFDRPVYGLEHRLPPGADPSLPRGGTRTYVFDPENDLPMLITARDERGRDVEYYRYDLLQTGVKLDDDDFDPDKLWGKGPTRTTAAGR